jgi:DNA-binding response OmpR family regulator
MHTPRILVVDDDRPSTLALSVRLRAAGYEVLTAHDAEAASRLALRQRPDLMLLDIDMPHYSGLELHECLQFSERGRKIPVVYVSGDDSLSNRMLAQQHGARGFVSKPYEPRDLLRTIENVLFSSAQPVCAS